MKYSLSSLLRRKGYGRVSLKKVKSGHYVCKVVLNGIDALFIVDSGASHTCVAWDKEAHFKINAAATEQPAASASSAEMETRHSEGNKLYIGSWEAEHQEIILFDITSVNVALERLGATPVDGILGADVLTSAKAVLDYNRSGLYLKH